MMSVMQNVALDANGQWIKCVLKAKFIVFFTQTSELQKISENFFLSKIVFFQRIFFGKNVFSDDFFQRNFHCFQGHYTVLK